MTRSVKMLDENRSVVKTPINSQNFVGNTHDPRRAGVMTNGMRSNVVNKLVIVKFSTNLWKKNTLHRLSVVQI